VFTRSSKRPALARVFWIHLLEVCWTFARWCKHPITDRWQLLAVLPIPWVIKFVKTLYTQQTWFVYLRLIQILTNNWKSAGVFRLHNVLKSFILLALKSTLIVRRINAFIGLLVYDPFCRKVNAHIYVLPVLEGFYMIWNKY